MTMRNVNVRSYDELLEEYALAATEPGSEPVFLGFGSLDTELRGVTPGRVLGIAARTSVGKTWLLETIEHAIAANPNRGTLALSLEMPGVEWAERALAIHADVAPEQVEEWAKDRELGRHAADFLERMKHSLVIEDPLSLDNLGAAIEAARGRLNPVPLRVLLIDYAGLLRVSGSDAYDRASSLARALKDVAKLERLAVIVALQLSRAGGDGSQPVTMTMLRDSGVLEESLDMLIGAWRPGKDPSLSPPDALNLANVLRVSVLKNRRGQEGRTVDLRFRPDSRRLYEEADPFIAAAG
jgi:replicative DNA helicase